MKVRELMTREVQFVNSTDDIAMAARKMKDMNIGLIPVMDDGAPRGLLTDRDIVIRTIAEGRDPSRTRVSEVMTRDVVFCHEDDDPKDVVKMMMDHKIRRILVKDDNDRVTGVLSLGDLASEGFVKEAGKTLREVSAKKHH